MIAAGLRCSPHKVFYTIIKLQENNSFSLANQELIIPKSFDIPNKLKYVRKTLLDIFKEYNVLRAGIRITENNAQSPDLFRIMLEAVIQELIASSNVEFYFTGVKGSIASTKYLEVSKNIFSHTKNIGHYNMMMGIGEGEEMAEGVEV